MKRPTDGYSAVAFNVRVFVQDDVTRSIMKRRKLRADRDVPQCPPDRLDGEYLEDWSIEFRVEELLD